MDQTVGASSDGDRIAGCHSIRLVTPVSRSTQCTVEVVRSADQCEMRESLGEVTLLLSCLADLFGIQADVVGVREHLFEGDSCFI